MGYCPRCGENSTFGDGGRPEPTPHPPPIRIAIRSKIVSLPDSVADGDVIAYGGVRFTVHREGGHYVLTQAG